MYERSGSGVVVRRRQPFRRGRAWLGVLTLVRFGVRPQQRPNLGRFRGTVGCICGSTVLPQKGNNG